MALRTNVQQVRSRLKPGCLLMAIVKANAYGHGALGAARIFCAAGVDRLAVAALGEGIELREGGLRVPIQVLGYTPGWLASAAVAYEITTTIFDLATARALNEAAAVARKRAIVHVKVNTGMNRLGVPQAEVSAFLGALRALEHLSIEGIFTHFATADLADKSFALQQFGQFERLLQQLEKAGLRPPLAHAANTAQPLCRGRTARAPSLPAARVASRSPCAAPARRSWDTTAAALSRRSRGTSQPTRSKARSSTT